MKYTRVHKFICYTCVLVMNTYMYLQNKLYLTGILSIFLLSKLKKYFFILQKEISKFDK